MHIVDNKLVGTIVSDVYSENGSVIIVLTDNDTTPVREMQTYSYIQTKELAEIGIAINPKGVVTIPGYTLEEFNNGLDPNLYAITVKYNGELYQIGLADFLELEVGDDVDYDPYEEGAFPGQTIDAVIPPFSAENAKQIVSVNDETGKLEWRDETEELPFISSGDAGKVLKVNSGATGTEWGDVPNELPSVTGNAGKVLKVNSGATGTEWGDIPDELPTIASGDAGKVLKVNAGETGTEWGTASGGAMYLHRITFIVDRNLSSVHNDIPVSVNIINSSSTPLTLSTLLDELRRLKYDNTSGRIFAYPATGYAILLHNSNTYSWQRPVGIIAHLEMGSWALGFVFDDLRYDSSNNTMESRGGVAFTTWSDFTDTVTQL